jgi:hypothetical protein
VTLHPLGHEPVRSKTVGIKASFPVSRLQVISCCRASDKGRGIKVVGLPSEVVKLPFVDFTVPIIVCGDNLSSSWCSVPNVHLRPSIIHLPILWLEDELAPPAGIVNVQEMGRCIQLWHVAEKCDWRARGNPSVRSPGD